MKLKGLICFLFFLLLMDACIDPFAFKSQSENIMVVEGMITDQPGPYLVRLFRSKALNDQISNSLNVQGASMVITSSDGADSSRYDCLGRRRNDGYCGKLVGTKRSDES